MTINHELLNQYVDEKLFYLWDPAGVNVMPSARDEYRAYVNSIVELLLNTTSADEVANHLSRIAENDIGKQMSKAFSLHIATILVEALEETKCE